MLIPSGVMDWFPRLLHGQGIASTGDELQEIGAIEKAGQRRRRRWLNDKVLRDMAGPMSAADMQSQVCGLLATAEPDIHLNCSAPSAAPDCRLQLRLLHWL